MAKYWTLFAILYVIGQIYYIVRKGQVLKNNKGIWSHWLELKKMVTWLHRFSDSSIPKLIRPFWPSWTCLHHWSMTTLQSLCHCLSLYDPCLFPCLALSAASWASCLRPFCFCPCPKTNNIKNFLMRSQSTKHLHMTYPFLRHSDGEESTCPLNYLLPMPKTFIGDLSRFLP